MPGVQDRARLSKPTRCPVVDGCLNPRLSGAGSNLPEELAAPTWLHSFLLKPFIPCHRTDGGQRRLGDGPLSRPSAAEGGGRRPAFTVVRRPAYNRHRGLIEWRAPHSSIMWVV